MNNYFKYFILFSTLFIFSGCSIDFNSMSEDEYVNFLEEENQNLRNEIQRISNAVEELRKENSQFLNNLSNENEISDLQIEYLIYRNSCLTTINSINDKINRNQLREISQISTELNSIIRNCETQMNSDFRNLENFEDLSPQFSRLMNRLENLEEDELRRISNNCIRDAEDLEFDLRDKDSSQDIDLNFYIREFERLKLECDDAVEFNFNDYRDIMFDIEDLIDNVTLTSSNFETIDLNSLIEEIKQELEEERLQREEEMRLQELQEEYDEYFNICNSHLTNIEEDYDFNNLSLNDLNWLTSSINSWCISSHNINFTDLNNYENIFSTANEIFIQLTELETQMIEELISFCIPEAQQLNNQLEEVENITQLQN
ncbi:MAG: hypothetical protein LAT82_05525, partial [Nanoarchaeota archaeon]|nr:hypothetical protein [Nanoarchaeota archaeon]